MLKNEQKKFLLTLARQTIRSFLFKEALDLECSDDPIYQEKRGAFVTIHKRGKLRGCIGYIKGYKSLYDTISDMAVAAAFKDPRFPALKQSELEEVDFEISILSELILIKKPEEIEIGRDGLFIENNHQQGLLLPQVAVEWKWDKLTFLQQTCQKAGLGINTWKDSATNLWRFEADIFSEKEFPVNDKD